MNWYYAIGGEIHGPVSRTELESLFSSGQLAHDTLVLQEGMYDWIHFVDLKKTTQILPVFGAAPKSLVAEPPVEHQESPGQEGTGGAPSEG